ESSKTVAVTLLPDLLAEADETFSLELSGAGLDPVVAQATILDDDATDPAPLPPPPTGDDFDLDFTLVNDWNSGAQWSATLTNLSGEDSDGWALAFDLPFEILDIWSAEIASVTGNRYQVDEAAWNGALADGASVTFGFVGNAGGVTAAELEQEADAEAFFT
ncbi:MAG: cellulose binding domain-containing protein, partial [Pseudomonadota bacterium]